MDWAALVVHDIHDFSGPPTLDSMYKVVFLKTLPYAGIFVALWFFFVAVLRLFGFGETIGEAGMRRGTWALKLAMVTHHVIITPLAFVGIWEDASISAMFGCLGCADAGTLMNRSPARPLCARALTPVTLGYFMGDLILLSQWNVDKSAETMLMLFHHVASLTVWPAAIYFDWVARYVIIMLSYEFTSLWLTIIWMLSSAGLKTHSVYKLAGLIFTASFVVMRIFGALPQLMAMWNSPPWSQAVELEASPGGIHPLCWLFSGSLVFPHLLNLHWGVKVVKGFAAVAMGKKEKRKGT